MVSLSFYIVTIFVGYFAMGVATVKFMRWFDGDVRHNLDGLEKLGVIALWPLMVFFMIYETVNEKWRDTLTKLLRWV